jgi:hypothetical protein
MNQTIACLLTSSAFSAAATVAAAAGSARCRHPISKTNEPAMNEAMQMSAPCLFYFKTVIWFYCILNHEAKIDLARQTDFQELPMQTSINDRNRRLRVPQVANNC